MAKASCISTMISPVAGRWTNPTQAPPRHRHISCAPPRFDLYQIDGTAISGLGYTTMTTNYDDYEQSVFLHDFGVILQRPVL